MKFSRALACACLFALAACSGWMHGNAPAPPPLEPQSQPQPEPRAAQAPPAAASKPQPAKREPVNPQVPETQSSTAMTEAATPATPAQAVQPTAPKASSAKPKPTPVAKPAPPAHTASSPAPALVAPRPPAAAPLDLASLEQRLKDTDAIGVMTKLSLKNQVDDLLEQFRDYYAGRARTTTLAQLRRPFDLLLMKVLALLQDRDPALAAAIHDSREALWAVLSDRVRFERLT